MTPAPTSDVSDFFAACARHRIASDRYVATAADVSAQLRREAERRVLKRSVLVVDDSHGATLVLVHALEDLAPLHVVTSELTASALNALLAVGVTVHPTECCADAVDVWRKVRSAVVVVDASLDGSKCGAAVIADIPRGPSAVLVSSIADADALADAARSVDAVPVARSEDGWEARLRAVVAEALTRETVSE